MHDHEGVTFDDARAEAALLEFLARTFVQELDRDALMALRHAKLIELLERVEPGCAAWTAAAIEDEARVEALAAEFCRLFLMHRPTAPVASAFAAGGSSQAEGERLAASVDAWEHRLGIELQDGAVWGNLPKDHLARLLGLRALALSRGLPDLVQSIDHDSLGEWVDQFCGAVIRDAELPVYRATAGLLREVLASRD